MKNREFDTIDEKAVTAMRMLSVDMIDKAQSGHPGLPLGASPMMYVLWNNWINSSTVDPTWINRDRFVLSAGHGSSMLYSALYLGGFGLTITDLKNFRQLGSLTPGHPEYKHTKGIDATTGPLGQGLGMAVGMAIAEKHLAGLYNKLHYNLIDHYTYALVGDGDLMEGISQEAIDLAGQMHLNKLIVLHDSNDITLDGPLSNSSVTDQGKRFKASGWNHLYVADGEDLKAIDNAIELAHESTDKPTVIEVRTVIGKGSPAQGTNSVHGKALTPDEEKATKEFYNWDEEPFSVPDDVLRKYKAGINLRGNGAHNKWLSLFYDYEQKFPELSENFKAGSSNKLTVNFNNEYKTGDMVATRSANSDFLQQLAEQNYNFMGGSADLSSSNKTQITGSDRFSDEDPQNDNLWFGVREFGESTAINGINLHGGLRAFGSTFFVFSDYLKPAIRLAALQKLSSLFIFTHDSLAVGEDGPTHEPIEQLTMLRSTPGVTVIRPADANEVQRALEVYADTMDNPVVLVLSRQKLPVLAGTRTKDNQVAKGAYVVSAEASGKLDGVLLATGSEVSLAIKAQEQLATDGTNVRVVSMPSMELFAKQSDSYKDSILPNVPTLSIEMGSTFGWERYATACLGVDTFGASGKGDEVVASYGFTTENVVDHMKALL